METKFEYSKMSIAQAIDYLKNNNDYFHKKVNAWQLLTKNETESVSNIEILDTANLLYHNLTS